MNQISVATPAGTPTGDAVPLQFSLGGVTTSAAVTIALSQNWLTKRRTSTRAAACALGVC